MDIRAARKLLFPLYYFLALCPFISPVYMPIDVKPYCLIIAAVILFLIPEKIIVPEFFMNLLLVSFVGLLALLSQFLLTGGEGGGSFLPLRKYINYISLFVIGVAGFNIFLSDGKPNEFVIKRMILLWLVAGIAEMFFPGLMQIVTPGARTSLSRGVTGLSMEPSFYGYTCFFFMIMAMKFRTGRVKYCALCVFQIVFLAKSAVGALYLIVLLGVYIFFTGSIRRRIMLIGLLALILIAVIIAVSNIESLKQSRMISLIIKIFENPNILSNMAKISETDGSVASRIHAITFGTGDFFMDMGLPHGFMYTGRIMSGYGAVLYELGIFGLAVIIMITRRLHRSFGFPAAAAVSVVMFSAVQLASPTFIFLVAMAEYDVYTARRKILA